jgi:hypothetical protein
MDGTQSVVLPLEWERKAHGLKKKDFCPIVQHGTIYKLRTILHRDKKKMNIVFYLKH